MARYLEKNQTTLFRYSSIHSATRFGRMLLILPALMSSVSRNIVYNLLKLDDEEESEVYERVRLFFDSSVDY